MSTSNCLDLKTEEKYMKILEEGKTLTTTISDIKKLINGNISARAIFYGIKDQNEIGLFERRNSFRLLDEKEKIAIKIRKKHNQKSFYWYPCSFWGFFQIAGAYNYNSNTKRFDNHIPTSNMKNIVDKSSFYGTDIRLSLRGIDFSDIPIIKNFVETYINGEYPIAEYIFYSLYFEENEDGNQYLKCIRDTTLSPRREINYKS